jgi:hypothetical protein
VRKLTSPRTRALDKELCKDALLKKEDKAGKHTPLSFGVVPSKPLRILSLQEGAEGKC